MDKTTIQVFKKDLPRINILRHQIKDTALTQPELNSFLLEVWHSLPKQIQDEMKELA